MIHECGHPLFGIFGYTPMVLGGTLAELIVPMLCAGYFFWKREIAAIAFCGFWFSKTFHISERTWLMHERKTCAGRRGEHDWAALFGQWDCWRRIRKSAERRERWDGLGCWRDGLAGLANVSERASGRDCARSRFDTAFPGGNARRSSPAAPIKQLSTNTKCNLLNVDFCYAARVCAHIRRRTITSRSFPLPKRPVGPSDGVHGSYQLARWVSTEKRLCIELLANFRVSVTGVMHMQIVTLRD